ncbi:hypothetical protein IC229_14290 [Spirosoma sp. BT702]|uniref:Uncharacterized protein n=1 Tax=Spirosoma profusum TaxID=2771354 RepID=A0A927AU07_9BACT|nr:hypothetical protein [Spirosoma profusum]MBD2701817.1 hypothetical protein [Spirosoma profusum]
MNPTYYVQILQTRQPTYPHFSGSQMPELLENHPSSIGNGESVSGVDTV